MTMRQAAAIAAVCAVGFALSPAVADESSRVAAAFDGEWISLTGTIKSVSDKAFTLNYGEGQITVEMDDYSWFDPDALKAGDRVTVSGQMDNDFHEARKIEASSVYVPRMNEYFFASAADEEEGNANPPPPGFGGLAQDGEWISVTGTVKRIDGQELLIDTGFQTLAVDGSRIAKIPGVRETPVGDTVEVGDRVSVTGEMDDADIFDSREIKASSVVILTDLSRR